MKKTTHDKANTAVSEAEPTVIVDDSYISRVTELLAPLKKTDPKAYEQAIKKVNMFKGKQLISPDAFAAKRLNAAPADSAPVQLSRDELMKSVADKNKQNTPDNVKKQMIKSIWVKDIHVDQHDESKSVATLEIVDMDDQTEETDFDIGTTKAGGNFVNADSLYKELKRNLSYSKKSKVTDQDVRLSMIHVAFNDGRIIWFYGKNKAPASEWVFSGEQKKLANSPIAKKQPKAAVYKSGNTTIYRVGEDEKVSASKDMPVYIVCDFNNQKLLGAYNSMKKAQAMVSNHPGAQIAISTEII